MKFTDMILMSLGNLFKRKVRTMLTVTGVIIGTCAIVVMVSLGLGIKQSMDTMLEGMGDLTVINVNNYGTNQGTDSDPLDDAMIEKFKEIEHVAAVTPVQYSYGNFKITSGKYEYNGQITGVNFEALESLGYQVTEGQLPSGTDTPSYTLLFGATAAYDFYNPKKRNGWISMIPDANGNLPDPYVNPMEDKLEIEVQVNGDTNKKVKPVKATCIGIMAEDWSKNPSPYGVFMDIKDVKALQKEYNKANNVKEDPSKKESYTQVIVKTDDMSSVAAVEEVIQSYGFNTSSMESIRKPLEEQSRTMQLFLGGIGAVSLLVAAFGIINTMTMSIYERTKEIGVMKVIGCRIGNIRTMFLMEAAAIGFMGGVIGVILSEGVSYAANTFSGDGGGLGGMFGMGMGGGGQLSIIPPWLIVGAILFATLIGLIAGLYPANRAVRISALSAIHQE